MERESRRPAPRLCPSEDLRPFLMGWYVCPHDPLVISHIKGSATRQLACQKKRGLPEFKGFLEICSSSPELSAPTGESESKSKAQLYVWSFEYLTFMLQQPMCFHSLTLHRSLLSIFFPRSCLGGFHNASQQLSDTVFKVNDTLRDLANKIWLLYCYSEHGVFAGGPLGLNHIALLNTL